MANAHETGLSASIFTSDYRQALDIARMLDSGGVNINGMTIHDEHALPLGGVKASGWGRFNGKGAVESFTWLKKVTMGAGGMLPLQAIWVTSSSYTPILPDFHRIQKLFLSTIGYLSPHHAFRASWRIIAFPSSEYAGTGDCECMGTGTTFAIIVPLWTGRSRS